MFRNLTLASVYELESNEARRIATMEGARGFAVALVFLVHYHAAFSAWAATDPLTAAVAQFFWTIGHSGVDLFFVLSGYLIYGAAIKPSLHYGRFMKRRVQRIYPTFLVVFAVYLVLSFVFPAESKLPPETMAAILYVLQNALLLPGIFPIEPMITVAWSLSYEFFFYLLLPIIAIGLGLSRWGRPARVVFWLALGALFVASWFVFAPQAPRMLMFVSGIVVWEAVQSRHPRLAGSRRREWLAIAVTMAAFASFPLFEGEHNGLLFRTMISACAFGFLVFMLFRAEGPLRPAFAWTPARWLGNMSYSYYLIHALVINAAAMGLHRLLPERLQHAAFFWAMMPFVLLATLVVSTLLFALVEKPFSLVARKKYGVPAAAEAAAP